PATGPAWRSCRSADRRAPRSGSRRGRQKEACACSCRSPDKTLTVRGRVLQDGQHLVVLLGCAYRDAQRIAEVRVTAGVAHHDADGKQALIDGTGVVKTHGEEIGPRGQHLTHARDGAQGMLHPRTLRTDGSQMNS